MKTATIVEPGTVEIHDVPRPEPAPDEVLIKVEASGICGTDVHIYKGEYLGTYPIVPGHEGAGIVTAVGTAVDTIEVGDSVAFEPNVSCGKCTHCLNNRQNFCERWSGIGVTRPGCMAEYVLAPESNVFGTAGLTAKTSCFVEPLSCVLHGIQKSRIGLGDRVLIAGAGPIGNLLLQSATNLGAAEIDVVERTQARREAAKDSGAARVYDGFEPLETDRYDVVIDATGSVVVLERLIDYVRYGGTMLFFGVAPAGEQMKIEPFAVFSKGLTIVSSYTSLRNSLQAVDMLRAGLIRVDALVSHELGLHELEAGIEMIESGDPSVRKVVINPTR